ncbi:SRPBCC domain-containing protein [bacterium]|nr:SRPBCC domain-containing protein [bacterium]
MTFAASVGKVWEAWTTAAGITAWLPLEATIEARVGGAFELFFAAPDREHMSTKGCKFTLVEPKKRLEFTWRGPDQFLAFMNDPEPRTFGTVEFSDDKGKTRMAFEHEGWGEGDAWDEAREWHRMAWERAFGNLKVYVETGKRQQ